MKRFRGLILPCLLMLAILALGRFSWPQHSLGDGLSGDLEGNNALKVAQIVDHEPAHVLVEIPPAVVPEKVTLAGKEISGPLAGNQAAGDAAPDIIFSSHVVASGDTLTDIAADHDTTIAAIQELNGLADEHHLLVGQQLIVPKGFSGSGVLASALEQVGFERRIIGHSAADHPIEAYRIGSGPYRAIIVGAVHGGYEWNTALLAYRMITHFSHYPDLVPENVTLHVIPVANPDGVAAVTGEPGPFSVAAVAGDTTMGRPNGNGVDLNRNWGCEWSPVGQWGQETVSGGERPISEPETRALRQFFIDIEPEVVVWLHSAAGLLIPGNCNDINHGASEQAAILYGAQSGYPLGEFTAYRVTGDGADWLAQHRIASFTVELSNHQDLEFERNLAGLLSLLEGIETLGEE